MSLTESVDHLKTLVLSFHPVIAIETVEEERVEQLLGSVAAEIPLPLFDWSVSKGLMRDAREHAVYDTGDPLKLLRHLEALPAEGIFWLKDFSHHLQEPVVARQFREVTQAFARNRSSTILTGDSVLLPRDIESRTARYELPLPRKDELRALMRSVLKALKGTNRIQMEASPADIEQILQALQGMTIDQARQAIAHAVMHNGKLDAGDSQHILDRKARTLREGGLLDYFPIQRNVTQLGGFDKLKAWLQRARVGFTPAARELNLSPPRGICIVGVQGCGKSLAAKAIAKEWRLPLLRLDAGKLYDKYVGESEKNLRQAIALAEAMAPVVLWIDELEKALGQEGSDADGGLNQRLFGSFLTWLQEKTAEVFVVATANDLFRLPPELLRKGRFDEIFFVDLPELPERERIFHIHLTLHKQNSQAFDLRALAEAAAGFSGAEIEQVTIAGLYRALYLKQALTMELLIEEMKQTIPLSVSRREDVEQLRVMARDRFVSVR
ncbi:MAG: AAA family ATPase [Cyanobacteria bacterium P01_D01_bin.123]